ncbi:MAG: DUF4432 family protein [Oscillospiraceae bacterium]|nr:DUF4432 family protein [Oscillospiraceae bacterium]
MARLFGRDYTRNEFLMYAGNPSNFAGVTPMTYTDGKAAGTRALEVRTGTGFEFTLLPDKCLDIRSLRYRGVTLSQSAKNGLTGNLWGQPIPGNFPSSVSGGMLFTAGLRNAGPESVEPDGTFHQCHGNIGVTPAENLCARAWWDGDEYRIEASGTMRESALFGHNLMLTRTVSTKLGSDELEITDVLENLNGLDEEFCILYHFNFGFPFLTEALKLDFGRNTCQPRTPQAAAGLAEAERIIHPELDFFEHVFFRAMEPDPDGFARVRAENPLLGIGAEIAYEAKNLPNLCQWKSMRAGDYSLGIEPANMYIMGRAAEREHGTLPVLEGFGRREFRLKLRAYSL